jgi:hypothetical protein
MSSISAWLSFCIEKYQRHQNTGLFPGGGQEGTPISIHGLLFYVGLRVDGVMAQ